MWLHVSSLFGVMSQSRVHSLYFEEFVHHSLTSCILNTLVISAKDSDIIDEAIYYFKANVFFKNYEIKVREN